MLIVLSTRAAVPNPTRRDCISLRDKHFEQFPSLYLGAYLGARTQRGIIVSARQRQPLSFGARRGSLLSFYSSTSRVPFDPNLCEYRVPRIRAAFVRHSCYHDTRHTTRDAQRQHGTLLNAINRNEANVTRNPNDFKATILYGFHYGRHYASRSSWIRSYYSFEILCAMYMNIT